VERFWIKVDKSSTSILPGVDTPCWNWTAGLRSKITRYGAFKFNNKTVDAHRVAFELQKGPIPDGLLVLHKCDNRICVRGDHLFLGTHLDNVQDMSNKGRAKWGLYNKKIGPPDTAWCKLCQDFYPKENFYRNSSHWSGYDGYCKSCSHKRARERKAKQRASKRADVPRMN
jgi:hypothetical protein